MKGNVTLNVDIRAPEDGLALVDTSLGEFSVKVGEEDMPGGPALAQAYRLQSLLDADKGFDPYGVLAREQRNVFEMVFPLPYKEVRVGEEWPLKVQMLGLGPGVTGRESTVAVLDKITGEPGARSAKIAMRSAVAVTADTEGAARAMGVSMSISGSAVFDVSSGHFESNTLTASMSMRGMAIPARAGAEGMGMENGVVVRLADSGTLEAEELARARKMLEVRKGLGQVVKLAREGKNGEALAVLREGPLKADFPEEHAHLIAAQIHARRGGWQEARDAVEKEIDQFPRSLQALQLAQIVYSRMGETAKAEEIQEKLRALMTGASAAPGTPAPGGTH